MIILGTDCIGKTTLGKKYKNCVDLEANHFRWFYDDKAKHLNDEALKGRDDLREENPAWPNNYINMVLDLDSSDKIILAGIYANVMEALDKKRIPYWIVCFDEQLLPDLVQRTIDRGNIESYTKKVADTMIRHNQIAMAHNKQIWINKEHRYLEDALINGDYGIKLEKKQSI